MNPQHGGSHDNARTTLHAAEAALEEAIRLQKMAETRCYQNIAEVAHDIKNPLTAMMGHIQLMRYEVMGPLGNASYEPSVRALDSSAARLLGICESLLGNPSESDANPAHPVTHVGALADEIVDLFAVQAKERGVQLDTDVPEDFPAVGADPSEMYRVLTNLVSNALKFTPKGGKVQILAEVDEDDNAFVMVVRDSGVGMTREQIQKVMEDTLYSTISPHGDVGTGHGLGIVNRIVHEMGGRMDIVSSENRGTRVRIKFPQHLLVKTTLLENDVRILPPE